MSERPILILKTGEAVAGVRALHGDFDQMFASALRYPLERFVVVRPHLQEPIPAAGSFSAALVTGSASSLTDPAPWMLSTGEWLVEAARARLPLLGVCFGHQLLALAFGGKVERSPKGKEIGTIPVRLSVQGARDPLFDSLPGTIIVQQTHEDVVAVPPPGAVVLAGSEHSDIQSLAIGELVRTVQFHPEFDAAISRGYLEERWKRLADDARSRGEDPIAWLAGVRRGIVDSPHGATMLANWLGRFVHRT